MQSQAQQSSQRPGLPCPQCRFLIEMSIERLLYQSEFKCPACFLTLTMDRMSSQPALELLQKLQVAAENVQKHKKFDL